MPSKGNLASHERGARFELFQKLWLIGVSEAANDKYFQDQPLELLLISKSGGTTKSHHDRVDAMKAILLSTRFACSLVTAALPAGTILSTRPWLVQVTRRAFWGPTYSALQYSDRKFSLRAALMQA
jgi:hypothetical protein